jgi:uncharacterized membrane protein YebE (DUF533 family)
MTNSWTAIGVCSQLVGSSGNASGSGKEATIAETLARVNPFSHGGVTAALIAQNSVNFQQKLVDEPCAIALYGYPLKAYQTSASQETAEGTG